MKGDVPNVRALTRLNLVIIMLIEDHDRRQLESLGQLEVEARWLERFKVQAQRARRGHLEKQPQPQVRTTRCETFRTLKLTRGCIAAAAAKINAQLQARKGPQQVDVPPIRSVGI